MPLFGGEQGTECQLQCVERIAEAPENSGSVSAMAATVANGIAQANTRLSGESPDGQGDRLWVVVGHKKRHMSLEQTIRSIFIHLSRLGRPIAARRKSGADERSISEKLSLCGLQSPPDFAEAYRLCDGTETAEGDALDEIQFFPGYYWMSLDEALATYDALTRDGQWNANWLPVFASGGGDFYSVICDPKSRDFGSVVGFILGEDDHMVEFVDITALLKTVERSFSEGAFFVTDGYLEANYSKMRAIARSIQPHFLLHEA